MSSEGDSPGPSEPHSERQRIRRIAKACEPCRSRKTKCDILEQHPCGECVKRSMGAECVQRVRARRRRKPSPDPSSAPVKTKKKRVALPDISMEAGILPPDSEDVTLDPYSNTTFEVPVVHTPAYAPMVAASSAHSLGSQNLPQTSMSARAVQGDVHFASAVHSPSHKTVRRSTRDMKRPTDRVEGLLYSLLQTKCPDLQVDFELPPERLIDLDVRSLSLKDIGISPGQSGALARARQWLNLHFTTIHHNTPFLHRPTVENIARRYFDPPGGAPENEVERDERALLFAVLALGSFRERTYDSEHGKYQSIVRLSMASPAGTPLDPNTYSASVLLFELAQQDLNGLDTPTELAVQALFLLHNYVGNTSLGRWSRDFVARAVMMSHEVGLNRRIPPGYDVKKKQPPDVAMRRSILYLYVLFADVYLSALDSHPPLIKRSDYDPTVFDPILYPSRSAGAATPPSSPTAGLSAFLDLVRTGGEVLERWRGPSEGDLRSGEIVHLLEVEQKLEDLRNRLGEKTFSIRFDDKGEIAIQGRAVLAGRLLRQIHYNWIRIAVREPYLEVPLLAHSSLAVCARSAISVLAQYRHVLSAGLLNLPWMQLRRIATSIELVIIAHIKGELLAQETEEAIRNSLVLFAVLGTRWQSSNRLADAVRRTAEALGLRTTQRKSRRASDDDIPVAIASQPTESREGQNPSLDALLSVIPSGTGTAVPASGSPGVDQQLMSDPFWDSLNAMWGQGAPTSIDMMDGFGSWMASTGFGQSPDLTIPSQVVGHGTDPMSWNYSDQMPMAGGGGVAVDAYGNIVNVASRTS